MRSGAESDERAVEHAGAGKDGEDYDTPEKEERCHQALLVEYTGEHAF